MTFRWYVVAAGLMALTSPALAQEKKDDRFEKAFFDPQLVLQRAKEIGVTPHQRTAILDVIKKAQVELVPLQMDMAEPALELVEMIEETKIDEAAALTKADKMLKIENEVKKVQMSLMIRIKNLLTKDQQDRLRIIRDGGRGDGLGGNGGANSPMEG